MRAQSLVKRQINSNDLPPATAASSRLPDDIPAHWPQPAGGPPAHWLELVRAKAPGLLDGISDGVLQTQPLQQPDGATATFAPPAEASPAPPLRVPPTERPAFVAAPQVDANGTNVTYRPKSIEPPTATAGGNMKAAAATPRRRLGLTFSEGAAPPARSPIYAARAKHRPQPLIVYPPEAKTPNWTASAAPPGAPPAPPAAPAYSEIAGAAHSTWVEPPRAASRAAPDLNIGQTLTAAQSIQFSAAEPPTVPVTIFPRYSERSPIVRPADLPSPPPPTPDQPRAVFSETTRLPRQPAVSEQPPLEGVWPSLPDMPGDSPMDGSLISRAWKQRERLDREQRGTAWSEPLS